MERNSKVHFDTSWTKSWITSEISAGRISGCAIEVIRQGETVFKRCFGHRSSSGDPVTYDTQFWIASMTKPVVSILVMQLLEEGFLSLTDKVSKYIPGFGDEGILLKTGETEATRRPVTLLDLLTHTSGVTYGQFGDADLHHRYGEAKVFDYSATNTQMARRLANLPLMFQPGTCFEYGMSTDVLGRVVEVVTGNTLEEALRFMILEPLQIYDTTFTPEVSRVADFPESTVRRTIAPDFNTKPQWHSGGAGLFSTISDYSRLARMLRGFGNLDGVQILSQDTFATMLKQHLPDDVDYGEYTPALGITAPGPANGLGFGLGFAIRLREIDETPGGLGEFFWPGVSGCNFWVDPKNELITVFMTHAPEHRTQHRIGLRNAVYEGARDVSKSASVATTS